MSDSPIPPVTTVPAERMALEAASILERISDAFIVLDHEYRFIYANPSALRDMRKSMDELRGQLHWDVFPASHDITAGRKYREAAETGTAQYFTQHYNYEGFDLHMEMAAYPTETGGVAVFWRDVTDRVRAEQRLRESEAIAHDRFAELDQVYRYAPLGLFTIDRDLRYTRVNERLAELNGRPVEAHIGRRVQDIVPDFIDLVEPHFRRVLDHGEATVDHELQGSTQASPGKRRAFLANYHPLRAANGEIVGLIGAVLEITRYREAEDQLRDSERRSRLLFRDAPVPMWLFDVETLRFVDVNNAAIRTYGWTAEEFLGMTLRDIRPPEELPRLAQSIAARGGAELAQASARHVTKDGRTRDVEVWTQTIEYQGRPTRIAMLLDVTDRLRAVEALTASEERYALAARATRNVIRDWQIVSGSVSWSSALIDVFGWPSADIGATLEWWLARVHPEDRDRVAAGLHAAVGAATRHTEWQESYRFERGDGRWAEVLDRGFISRDDTGQAVRMIGAVEDMTAQKELEERLRQSQRMEAMGQLAGGIAHDFNNLLTVIVGNLDFVRNGLPETHPVRTDLEEIGAAADRARTLVRQLLTFSRKQPVRTSLVSVGEVVQAMERLLRPVIGEEISFDVMVAPHTPLVRIDPGQLEQVVMNLVVNARHAILTPAHGHPGTGGTLSIEVASVEGIPQLGSTGGALGVELVVRDSGHGMDEQTLSRLYEPFFTTKPVGSGTGLGLATVHGIVQQAGGQIAVRSTAGQGTTFSVRFPAAEPGRGEPTPTSTAAIPEFAGLTILIAEDESPVRAIVRRILEHHGAHVLEARHGYDALALWTQHRRQVDLVVTDLRMPALGGRELVARLRQEQPELRALFLSGYADGPAVLASRIDRFVEKPFAAETLLAAVHELLAGGAVP